MRTFIFFDKSSVVPKTKGIRSVLGRPHQSNDEASAEAANAKGQLTQMAATVTRTALERRFLQRLEKEKIGTNEIEVTSISLDRNHQTQEGIILQKVKKSKIKNRLINELRDPEKVVDQIRLRLKYIAKKEEALRRAYVDKKRSIAIIFQKNPSKLKRMRQSIQRDVCKIWNQGTKRMEKKVAWLKEKYSPKVAEIQRVNSMESWIARMSKGSGKNRTRAKIEVPIFGDIQLEEDELQVLKLNPKFRLFPKITLKKSEYREP